MPEPPSEPQTAFVAAAIALLVTPLLTLFGLSAIGLAAGFLGPANQRLDLTQSWLVLTLFIVWVLLVVAFVLVFGVRLARRITRS